MLFVLVDNANGAIDTAWLVPSADFHAMCGTPTTKGHLRFSASISPASADKWSPYRLTAAELPLKVVDRLEQLGA